MVVSQSKRDALDEPIPEEDPIRALAARLRQCPRCGAPDAHATEAECISYLRMLIDDIRVAARDRIEHNASEVSALKGRR